MVMVNYLTTDYVLVKNHILNVKKLKRNALKAADVNRMVKSHQLIMF